MANDRDSAPEACLTSDVEQLRIEVKQLRQDNEDLRESALWWQRLYEAAIERMNDGSQQLLSKTSHQDATMAACVDVAALATTIQQRPRFSVVRTS